MHLLMRRSFALFALPLFGCHDVTTSSVPAVCRVTPMISPVTVTIPVGSAVTFASTLESGCPRPLFRNESPAILQLDVDSLSVASVHVHGIAAGVGHFRIRAGADTTLSTLVSVTVTPLGPP